ncbi:uncharacterized protein AB675_9787 [Cyphellophora attinorum]|uniref:Xylanolytic transcriptional activator regulatory domain-containing protein n=1 Tax=Cyphellophora attinorum TaxID=1664694 RepID=A0A0N1HTT1_9EURO|nr:uncharacterized protein AB675_9787 [Phialophora attinorum]KPI42556.1 hypothetical protein AB675_9787 [Phialophora attinorum]
MLSGCQRLISPSPYTTVFYGSHSEPSFILRTLELFHYGPLSPEKILHPLTKMFNWPAPKKRHNESTSASVSVSFTLLSERYVAVSLFESLFNASDLFTAFLRRDTVREVVEAVHNPTSIVHLHSHAPSFALYHAVIALGHIAQCKVQRYQDCPDSMLQAWTNFHAAEELVDPQSCIETLSVQALICQLIFLISTSRITSAHGLLGLAYSALLRLGYHRSDNMDQQSLAEQILRAMMFSTVVKIDLYVGLMLDLPRFVPDDLVRDCLHTIHRLHELDTDLSMVASAKHLELLHFASKARQVVFNHPDSESGAIDAGRLASIERQLQHLSSDLSALTRQMGDNPSFVNVKYQLETTLYATQLILFRPFLHYLCTMAKNQPLPLAQSRHALACVKIASTTILRSEVDSNITATFSSTYALFVAVTTLIFLISAHEGTAQPGEAWKRAVTGLRGLYGNRCSEDIATTGLEVLEVLVGQLSHTVDFDFRGIEKEAVEARMQASVPSLRPPAREVQRARTTTPVVHDEEEEEIGYYADADRLLARAETMPLGFGFVDLLEADLDVEMDQMD